MSSFETELDQYEQAKQEAIDGENAATDDYYRIPAIMQDCKTAYNLSWNGSGAWEGNTFVRTASMPNINGTITFKATISIARKQSISFGLRYTVLLCKFHGHLLQNIVTRRLLK